MQREQSGSLANQMDFSGIRGRGDNGQRQAGNSNSATINVGKNERLLSGVAGGALVFYGLSRMSLGGIVAAMAGGALMMRGVSGNCKLYSALGVNTAEGTTSAGNAARQSKAAHDLHDGIHVERAVTINRPIADVYAFWRNLTNLPRFMEHLQSVTQSTGKCSHWVAKAPAGMTVEWDAEIITERENELIAWKSLEGADVDNAGVVRFTKAPGDRGTEVHVTLRYNPPAGRVGALAAKLFGEEPQQQINEDLRRFKQVMETGEIATIKGQAHG